MHTYIPEQVAQFIIGHIRFFIENSTPAEIAQRLALSIGIIISVIIMITVCVAVVLRFTARTH